jgi:Eukaryotic aspartyl protease
MDVAPAAFWYQMFEAKMIGARAFSLCFSRQEDAARSGTEAGAMSLGGTDDRLHETPLVYSATSESSGFYVVHITKMYLRAGGGGLSALSSDPSLQVVRLDISEDSLNSGRVIVDSGTTDTYFSRRLQSEFSKVYQKLTGQVYDHSVKHFTPEELAKQPTILFQLRGNADLNKAVVNPNGSKSVVGLAGELDPDNPYDVILAIPPEHYYEYDPESKGYVSRFYVDESGGGVLGANAMMGHDVYFDVDNLRIGWAESSCDYTKLVMDYTDNYTPSQNSGPEDSRIEPADEGQSDDGDGGKAPFSGTDDGEGKGGADGDDTFDDKPQDGEPSGKYDYAPVDGSGVCTGLACQATVLAGIVLGIIYVAQRMVRRAPSGPAYDLTQSELELNSIDGSGYDDGDYSDRRNGTLS